MSARIRSGIVIAITVAAAIVLRGWFARALFMGITVISVIEMLCALRKCGDMVKLPSVLFACVAMPLYAAARDRLKYSIPEAMFLVFLAAGIAMIVSAIWVLLKGKVDYDAVVSSILPIIYPGLLSTMMYPLIDMKNPLISALAVALVLMIAFISDVFGFLIGCRFGKHRLSPQLSPKKSVEGAVAGAVAGTLLAPLMMLLVKWGAAVIPWMQDCAGYEETLPAYWSVMILGLVGSVLAQFGDLMASLFKRRCGIKDYGNLIPGHGGMMDRMDGAIFCAMACFLYFFYLV